MPVSMMPIFTSWPLSPAGTGVVDCQSAGAPMNGTLVRLWRTSGSIGRTFFTPSTRRNAAAWSAVASTAIPLRARRTR